MLRRGRPASPLIALLVTAVVVGGCASKPPRRAVSTQVVSSGVTHVVYVLPDGNPRADGHVLTRAVTPLGVFTDTELSSGNGATYYPASSLTPGVTATLQWNQSTSEGPVVFEGSPLAQPTPPIVINSDPVDSAAPASILNAGGQLYYQRGGSVVQSSGGVVERSFSLPLLADDPEATRASASKGPISGGPVTGTVFGLVQTLDSEILALTSTGQASAVTDLSTGTSASIPSLSKIGPAAIAPSGEIVTAGWDAQSPEATLKIVEIEPHTLKVDSIIDTHYPVGEYRTMTILPGVGHDAVVSLSNGSTAESIRIAVWTVDPGKADPIASPLPGRGLWISPNGDNSVFMYGGPSGNLVSVMNLTNGQVVPADESKNGPPGSYVIGVGAPN